MKAAGAGNDRSRLVLGTAQIGMAYGIANVSGRPSASEACALIEAAWSGGVRAFDTAAAYGDSEAVLGEALSRVPARAAAVLVTKVHSDVVRCGRFAEALGQALGRLGAQTLDTVLFHDEGCLDDWSPSFDAAVAEALDTGRVRRVGVSLYTPAAARRALDLPRVGALQIPGNLLDRRFASAAFLDRAAAAGVHLFVRSVFLQGLLLMDVADIPRPLASAAPAVAELQGVAESLGVSLPGLALGYAGQRWPEASVIFGAETSAQVELNLREWDAGMSRPVVQDVEARLAAGAVEEIVLRPDLWGRA